MDFVLNPMPTYPNDPAEESLQLTHRVGVTHL